MTTVDVFEQHLHVADDRSMKPPHEREVVAPEALKGPVIAHLIQTVAVRIDVSLPFGKGARVVIADVLEMAHAQARCSLHGVEQHRREGRQPPGNTKRRMKSTPSRYWGNLRSSIVIAWISSPSGARSSSRRRK